MKKISLLAILAIALLVSSCKKEEDKQETPQHEVVLTFVGRWMTEDGGYYEVYNNDGTGKFWAPADDVYEEEAQTFTWEVDSIRKCLSNITRWKSVMALSLKSVIS